MINEYLKLQLGNKDQVLSIDSAQGREWDIVLLSIVRSEPGEFISEYKRINVAITRARHGLVVFGRKDLLMKDEKWKKLLMTYPENIVDGIEGA